MAITFSIPLRQIILTSPQTDVTIQDLYNAIREFEDDTEMMSEPKITDGFGKQDLNPGDPGTKLVGITLQLVNGWQVKAADRAGPALVQVTIRGGNIVSLDTLGDGQPPVVVAAFVSYTIESDVSAALISGTTSGIESSLSAIEDQLDGRKQIDFTGNDSNGWQEIVYDAVTDVEVKRFNLFDETGTRINETVLSFVSRGGMIADRVPV